MLLLLLLLLKSVELYTEALSHVRHWTALYTNRAQAYLRLENFEVSFCRFFLSLGFCFPFLPLLNFTYYQLCCVYVTYLTCVVCICVLCEGNL